MTKQEVFNKVRDHLLKQNRQASVGDRCMYLTPHGDRCAVGCLLTDEQANECEGTTAVGAIRNPDANLLALALRAQGIGKECWNMLQTLQNIHDRWDVDRWPDQLGKLAREEGF